MNLLESFFGISILGVDLLEGSCVAVHVVGMIEFNK